MYTNIQSLPMLATTRLVALRRRAKLLIMLGADLLALSLAMLTAMLLQSYQVDLYAKSLLLWCVVLAMISIFFFHLCDLYRAVTRFIGLRMLIIASLGLGASVLGLYALAPIMEATPFPGSILAVYWLIAVLYLMVSRLSLHTLLKPSRATCRSGARIVAIFGAGESGVQLVRSMGEADEFRAVCFLDEKRGMICRTVAGIEVFDIDTLRERVAAMHISVIVIAIPQGSPARLRQVVHKMRAAGVTIKILRSIFELGDEKNGHQTLREVRLEDLLGRPAVPPKPELFELCVRAKSVLVTGAGGSIGSELCRQVAALGPSRLDLLDHSEYGLYTIANEIKRRWPQLEIHAHLGSVCTEHLLERVVSRAGTDTIYHAAAYKHVPILEENVVEGIRNNVVGAQRVVAVAELFGVAHCVLISSDKAVRPTNIMGATKRIAELVFQAAAERARAGTRFSMVRFGNLLGSSGSVVPLFSRQIVAGGPLTVTHPDVFRYFMLIPEAAQLVIQASAMAQGGEVFVLDMGAPVRIVELARTMIELSGLTEKTPSNPHGDIAIDFIGLFPGEKLHEELLIGNHAGPSAHPAILCVREEALASAELDRRIAALLLACCSNDRSSIERMVSHIVSDFSPQGSAAARDSGAAPTPAKQYGAISASLSDNRMQIN